MIQREATTWQEKVRRLDPIGTFCLLPCIVCLLLALQWGGVTYNWSNARVIALLGLTGVLCIAFVVVQKLRGDDAMVPARIFLNRSILAGSWFSLCNGAALQVMFYFLPIWFQAIKHASAVKSGIMNLPCVLGLVITGILAGALTKRTGYYTPWMLLSSVLSPIGAGLISTFSPSTGHPAWIGYQALFGLGCGLGMMQPSVAAQTVLPRKDVSIGAALAQFFQLLGGAVFISVANNIFNTQLEHNLATIPGIDVRSVATEGATTIKDMVPAELLPQVLMAYNDALRAAFYLGTALASATVLGSLAMEWRSVKQGQQEQNADDKQHNETSA